MPGQLSPPDWIEARQYQQQAVSSWVENSGNGILRMATGTGKTVTGLLAASHVTAALEGQLLLVVAAPYQHLVDQWADDLRDFGAEPVFAYQSRRDWQPRLERQILEYNQGSRGVCTVVTTHTTLSMAGAQSTLQRANGPAMLIADEVHHLGSDHMQQGLLDAFDFRLGLSATPERYYDEEGTETLHAYFGDTVFEYDLTDAIEAGALCEYYYVPHIVELDGEELDEYLHLSEKVGRLIGGSDEEDGISFQDNQALQNLLIKRARLVGTAENKLDLLTDLINAEHDVSHALVYCSDGSMGVDAEGRRHVEETTERLRSECGLRVEPFTAEESQSEREQLLQEFEAGDIDVLSAIRCLDEGVDVPATRTAYILASSSNPRQYVQRRGRILRQYEGKQYAVIHDFVVVPGMNRPTSAMTGESYDAERSLLKKELDRVSLFAESAINHPDAEVSGVPTSEGSLQNLKRKYDLLDA
jgi:DNA phosphorothioation system restriction enzyme